MSLEVILEMVKCVLCEIVEFLNISFNDFLTIIVPACVAYYCTKKTNELQVNIHNRDIILKSEECFFAFYDQGNKVLRLLRFFKSDLVSSLIYGEIKKIGDELNCEMTEMLRLVDRVEFVLNDKDLLRETERLSLEIQKVSQCLHSYLDSKEYQDFCLEKKMVSNEDLRDLVELSLYESSLVFSKLKDSIDRAIGAFEFFMRSGHIVKYKKESSYRAKVFS